MATQPKTDKTATETPTEAPKAKTSKPPKMLHHAYAMAAADGDSFSEVVTFGTWSGAAEYALPRKWDVVSGLPGVPLTELIKAGQS
jgi:hypothetical protein